MGRVLLIRERGVLLGILSTVVAGFIVAAMDALAKWLMQELPTLQVIWARYFFHTLIVGVVFSVRSGPGFVKTRQPLLQSMRAICLLCVSLCMYFSIRTISLADATAILFFAPIMVTLLAGVFLREPVGLQKWLAVTVGFIGVLFIVQPGFRELQPAMLLALVAAILLSFYYVLTRVLRGKDHERTTLFHGTALGTVALTCLLPFWWVSPSPQQWAYLAIAGAMGASGHFLLVKAFHLAPAPTINDAPTKKPAPSRSLKKSML